MRPADWLIAQGMQALDGPINLGEKNMYWGLLIKNFTDPPIYGVNYDPPYYRDLLEGLRVQGVLPIKGLKTFAPGKNLQAVIKHADGSSDAIELKHTFNAEQIKWFQAGSALNLLRSHS